MALGADKASVLRLFIGQELKLGLAGIALGAIGALLPIVLFFLARIVIGEAGALLAAALAAIYPNLIYYNRLPKGGHFAAWEQPKLFSEEIRAGFRSLRSAAAKPDVVLAEAS